MAIAAYLDESHLHNDRFRIENLLALHEIFEQSGPSGRRFRQPQNGSATREGNIFRFRAKFSGRGFRFAALSSVTHSPYGLRVTLVLAGEEHSATSKSIEKIACATQITHGGNDRHRRRACWHNELLHRNFLSSHPT